LVWCCPWPTTPFVLLADASTSDALSIVYRHCWRPSPDWSDPYPWRTHMKRQTKLCFAGLVMVLSFARSSDPGRTLAMASSMLPVIGCDSWLLHWRVPVRAMKRSQPSRPGGCDHAVMPDQVNGSTSLDLCAEGFSVIRRGMAHVNWPRKKVAFHAGRAAIRKPEGFFRSGACSRLLSPANQACTRRGCPLSDHKCGHWRIGLKWGATRPAKG
jgi:hypothetical protein